jgi:predicted ester cyclase
VASFVQHLKTKKMNHTTAQNKAIVSRFNKEVIEEGNMETFKELVAPDLFNHAAPAGMPTGPDGMIYFLRDVLKGGFPDLRVEILDQVAEGDLVTSRKQFQGTHTGIFMGIAASDKKVVVDVIEIIRLRDGKYVEHWGISNLRDVMMAIAS